LSSNKKHYHFIAIGGVSMSAIAAILHEQGHIVTGSDRQESGNTLRLSESGIKVHIGHSPENVNGADVVVYNAAIKPDNPELAEAIKRGIPTLERPAMLGKIMEPYKYKVGVAGTHGKTTTTSMLGSILDHAGMDATVLFGSDMKTVGGNVRIGDGSVIVTEACEAFGSFLHLKPSISIITNIEADHLDHYGNVESVEQAFRKFVDGSEDDAVVVACADDPRVRKVLDGCTKRLAWFGTTGNPNLLADDIYIKNPEPSYTLIRDGKSLGRITVGVPGMQNVLDSLAAAGAAFEIGVGFESVKGGLADFHGTGRRFEILYKDADVMVVDDYAHHPTEIRATLSGTRAAFPGRRITAIFQPHLYTRTRDFYAEFAESLAPADRVIVTSIYAARELPIDGVSAEVIVKKMHDNGCENVSYIADKDTIAKSLVSEITSGDIIIDLGAGDIRTVGEELAAILERDH
jgi:UDP-N-acetylmuramate--alanine ligase